MDMKFIPVAGLDCWVHASDTEGSHVPLRLLSIDLTFGRIFGLVSAANSLGSQRRRESGPLNNIRRYKHHPNNTVLRFLRLRHHGNHHQHVLQQYGSDMF